MAGPQAVAPSPIYFFDEVSLVLLALLRHTSQCTTFRTDGTGAGCGTDPHSVSEHACPTTLCCNASTLRGRRNVGPHPTHVGCYDVTQSSKLGSGMPLLKLSVASVIAHLHCVPTHPHPHTRARTCTRHTHSAQRTTTSQAWLGSIHPPTHCVALPGGLCPRHLKRVARGNLPPAPAGRAVHCGQPQAAGGWWRWGQHRRRWARRRQRIMIQEQPPTSQPSC